MEHRALKLLGPGWYTPLTWLVYVTHPMSYFDVCGTSIALSMGEDKHTDNVVYGKRLLAQ